MDVNQVLLEGVVDAYGDKSPVEVRFTKSGMAVASFQLKTEEVVKGKTYFTWHDITAWGEMGEGCGNYQKGTRLSIKGRLSRRSWEDKEGKKRYKVEVVANNIDELGGESVGGIAPAEDCPF